LKTPRPRKSTAGRRRPEKRPHPFKGGPPVDSPEPNRRPCAGPPRDVPAVTVSRIARQETTKLRKHSAFRLSRFSNQVPAEQKRGDDKQNVGNDRPSDGHFFGGRLIGERADRCDPPDDAEDDQRRARTARGGTAWGRVRFRLVPIDQDNRATLRTAIGWKVTGRSHEAAAGTANAREIDSAFRTAVRVLGHRAPTTAASIDGGHDRPFPQPGGPEFTPRAIAAEQACSLTERRCRCQKKKPSSVSGQEDAIADVCPWSGLRSESASIEPRTHCEAELRERAFPSGSLGTQGNVGGVTCFRAPLRVAAKHCSDYYFFLYRYPHSSRRVPFLSVTANSAGTHMLTPAYSPCVFSR